MKASSLFVIPLILLLLQLYVSIPVEASVSEEIEWEDYTAGLLKARSDGKPVMIDFYTDWCYYCIIMEETTYTNHSIINKTNDFVFVKVNGDYNQDLLYKFNIEVYPTTVFLMPDGEEIDRIEGYASNETLIRELESAMDIFDSEFDPENTDYPPLTPSSGELSDEPAGAATSRVAAVMVGVIATAIVFVLILSGKKSKR